MTNLLPAILLAATPHNGKSVLAYLLSQRLRDRRIPHILLRTAPDGEGNWFYQGQDVVHLRQKGIFTPELVAQMRSAIQNRRLPMLVDIGGRPQADQFGIFDDCTHVIHLFRDEADREISSAWLEQTNLLPVALLHSRLHEADIVEDANGLLRGVIGGLDRQHPRPGVVFAHLLARVEGICTYPEQELRARHLAEAPDDVAFIIADELARRVGAIQPPSKIWFERSHLPAIIASLSNDEPVALYGSMPIWLAATIAAYTAPAPCYWFDARHYGWVQLPQVELAADAANEEFTLTAKAENDGVRLEFKLAPGVTVLSRRPIHAPVLPIASGIIFDGPMPGWFIAALARAYLVHPWLAAFEPRQSDPIRFWPHP
jgi:CRISPR-associated protein Csx3